jgi:hypothetical protein
LAVAAQQMLGAMLKIPQLHTTALNSLSDSASNLLIYNSFTLNDTSNYTQGPMLRSLQASSQNYYMNIKGRIA